MGTEHSKYKGIIKSIGKTEPFCNDVSSLEKIKWVCFEGSVRDNSYLLIFAQYYRKVKLSFLPSRHILDFLVQISICLDFSVCVR